MSKRRFFGLFENLTVKNKVKQGKGKANFRRKCLVEELEDRGMLSSVGLAAIANQTIPAGTSLLIPLNGSDSGNTVRFLVTSTDNSVVTPILMPESNTSVDFTLQNYGTLTFQLFDNLVPTTTNHIETLVNDGFYNGDYIYRAQAGFVLQGGNDPPQLTQTGINTLPSGVPSTIDEEFNPDLVYTSPGALAMARTSAANSSSTEFFDTEAAARNLDFGYTLFGLQTVDPTITVDGTTETITQAIQNLPTETSSGFSYLNTPVKITSATTFTDTQDGVLMLKAADNASGTETITVTAYDGTNTPTTETFTVTAATDTGVVNANPWDSSRPAAPTSVQVSDASGTPLTSTITDDNNSSSSTALNFLVSGVTAGNQVTIYASGNAIGSAVVPAGSTSVVVPADSNESFGDGQYTIDAVQTALNVSVTDSADSNTSETANVDSIASPNATVTIFTDLFPTNSPASTAQVGKVYTYSLQTNAPAGDAVTVIPVTLPAGMTTDGNGNFTWTPTQAEGGTTQVFAINITDAAGNTHASAIQILVGSTLQPVAIPASASGGNITVTFSGSTAVFYDNIGKQTLATEPFTSIDTLQIAAPSGQTNYIFVVAPSSASAPHPAAFDVTGVGSTTDSRLIVSSGNGTNQFSVSGNTVTANGLQMTVSNFRRVRFVGGKGTNNYQLISSTTPVAISAGANDTLDFSKAAAGVTVNLGLDNGQAQYIAPLGTTLSIYGVIGNLIGSNYADDLIGGPAATTIIHSGLGNDTIVGGSGNNILMGGGGNDTIRGGPRDNTLIAGKGTSKLYGGGAGSSNIFIGGTTNDDSNIALLEEVNQLGVRALYGWLGRQLIAQSIRIGGTSALLSMVNYGAHDQIYANGGTNLYMTNKTDSIS